MYKVEDNLPGVRPPPFRKGGAIIPLVFDLPPLEKGEMGASPPLEKGD
jgi:hypothetical protein